MLKLTDLPDKLLRRVRGHIHALEGHVFFNQTCKTVAALYKDDEKFWRPAVLLAGWGLPKVYQTQMTKAGIKAPWRALAAAVVKDAAHFQSFPHLAGRTLRDGK